MWLRNIDFLKQLMKIYIFTVLEVASNEHPGDMNLLEQEANSYAHEMSKIARNEICNGKGTGTNMKSLFKHSYSYKIYYHD